MRQLRRPHRSGQGPARPDAGGDPQPAADLTGRDAQPLPQQFAHHRTGGQGGIVGPVGRFGDLAEEPVHQAPVDPVLSFQPLGHLHPEPVSHHVRARRPQPGVSHIDSVQRGTNLVARLLGADDRTHASTLSNICAKFVVAARACVWTRRLWTTHGFRQAETRRGKMGRVLRWTTAGESHGRALVAVVEGMVAGVAGHVRGDRRPAGPPPAGLRPRRADEVRAGPGHDAGRCPAWRHARRPDRDRDRQHRMAQVGNRDGP